MTISNKKTIFVLLLIMAVAIFFRFYNLSEIPPGLYPDVAINGNDALNALKTHDFQAFYPENNGREGLFMNLIALSFYLFGVSVWAIKLVPAIIGTLTVLGFYLMVRELLSQFREVRPPAEVRPLNIELISLLSTFFLSISFWHVNFSRLGFRAIMVPFILVWGFFFLFRAIHIARTAQIDNADKPPKNIRIILYTLYFILAGLVFGLGFHTYISYRVAPAIIGLVFLIEVFNWWKRRKKKTPGNNLHLALWIIFFAAIAAAASPMALYFYNNPQDFMGRTGQVSVLASENPLKELAISTAKSLGMFNVWGDCNWRHNIACQPALPLPIGLLFLIGFFISIKYFLAPIFRRLKLYYNENSTSGNTSLVKTNALAWSPAQISLFLLAWFFVMLLPEILTNEGLPHSLRAIGAIPPVYIFTGLGGWILYSKLKFLINKYFSDNPARTAKWNAGLDAFCIAFLIALVLSSYQLYFIKWGQNPIVKDAFTQRFVDIGNYLNNLPGNAKKYVIANENGVPVPYPDGTPVPAQTVMFIEKASSSSNKAFYLKPENISWFQGLSPKADYPLFIVLMKYDKNILDELQKRAPNGIIKEEPNNIWVFQIKN